jgi:hypothetical protein
MRTSSFFDYQGEGRISIARSAPRGMSGFRICKTLAPGAWFKTAPYDDYRRRYAVQLAELEPQQVWDDLHDLVDPHEPVLLCWERGRLSEDNWCHRRMLAMWLQHHLHREIHEIGMGSVDAMGRAIDPAQARLL